MQHVNMLLVKTDIVASQSFLYKSIFEKTHSKPMNNKRLSTCKTQTY